MTRIAGCAVLGTCVVLAAPAAVGQAPVFRSAIDTVRVYATVTNREGQLVPGLAREDFEVKSDGAVQPIVAFDNTPVPIRLIVLLDVSTSMNLNVTMMREGAEALLMRLRPDDRARVGTFSGHNMTMSPAFTSDFDGLSRALPRRVTAGSTYLYGAIATAMDAFKAAGDDERRVILAFSDGITQDIGPNVNDLVERARREAVMIYGITMPGEGDTKPFDDVFTSVAAESGGGFRSLSSRRDIPAAFARVADELHAQYLLGFEPPKRDGRTHKIDVRAVRRGLAVRARRSYVAPMKE